MVPGCRGKRVDQFQVSSFETRAVEVDKALFLVLSQHIVRKILQKYSGKKFVFFPKPQQLFYAAIFRWGPSFQNMIKTSKNLNEAINQSINRTINPAKNQSHNQSINQSTQRQSNPPINRKFAGSSKHPTYLYGLTDALVRSLQFHSQRLMIWFSAHTHSVLLLIRGHRNSAHVQLLQHVKLQRPHIFQERFIAVNDDDFRQRRLKPQVRINKLILPDKMKQYFPISVLQTNLDGKSPALSGLTAQFHDGLHPRHRPFNIQVHQFHPKRNRFFTQKKSSA